MKKADCPKGPEVLVSRPQLGERELKSGRGETHSWNCNNREATSTGNSFFFTWGFCRMAATLVHSLISESSVICAKECKTRSTVANPGPAQLRCIWRHLMFFSALNSKFDIRILNKVKAILLVHNSKLHFELREWRRWIGSWITLLQGLIMISATIVAIRRICGSVIHFFSQNRLPLRKLRVLTASCTASVREKAYT